MEHMKHLQAVVDSDVRVLQKKEATYQGSWKRAGGRSAWFMMRRNMDRLIEMMKKPDAGHGFSVEDLDDAIRHATVREPTNQDVTLDASIVKYLRDSYLAENVFAKIRENPDGRDGTVLACLRDLRRYLTLIEAEMISRGVVKNEMPATLDELLTKPLVVMETVVTTDPVRAPWQICHAPMSLDSPQETELLQHFYSQRTETMWQLEPFVVSDNLPRSLVSYYNLSAHDNRTWVLRVQNAPAELRDQWPRLQPELNAKEHEDHPNRFMYEWLDGPQKYRLRDRYVTFWGREA
jgi:hypothetical protein